MLEHPYNLAVFSVAAAVTYGYSAYQVLAQVSVKTGVETVGSVLQDRSDALVILVGILILLGMYIWFVIVPNRREEAKYREEKRKEDIESRRREDEIKLMQASGIAELSKTSANVDRTTSSTRDLALAIIDAKRIQFDALSVINESMENIDISDFIAQGNAILDYARRQEGDSVNWSTPRK